LPDRLAGAAARNFAEPLRDPRVRFVGADSLGAVLILPASGGAGSTFLAARFAGSAIRFTPRASAPAGERIAQDRPHARLSGVGFRQPRERPVQPRECAVRPRKVRGSAAQVRGSAAQVRGSAAQVRGSAAQVRGSAAQVRGSAADVPRQCDDDPQARRVVFQLQLAAVKRRDRAARLKPRPEPGSDMFCGSRTKRSTARARSAGAMPGPRSATVSRTRSASCRAASTISAGVSGAGVAYLSALSTRFAWPG